LFHSSGGKKFKISIDRAMFPLKVLEMGLLQAPPQLLVAPWLSVTELKPSYGVLFVHIHAQMFSFGEDAGYIGLRAHLTPV
jgi:hypothetical protein